MLNDSKNLILTVGSFLEIPIYRIEPIRTTNG